LSAVVNTYFPHVKHDSFELTLTGLSRASYRPAVDGEIRRDLALPVDRTWIGKQGWQDAETKRSSNVCRDCGVYRNNIDFHRMSVDARCGIVRLSRTVGRSARRFRPVDHLPGPTEPYGNTASDRIDRGRNGSTQVTLGG
jgi:hypothetical protein